MDSPRPILAAELEFFNKGTGRGEPNEFISHLIGFGELFTFGYHYLLIIVQLATKSSGADQ